MYTFCLTGTINTLSKVLQANNHVLSLSASISWKEVTMLSTGNKEQIIDIISMYLINKLENTNYRKFVVTFLEDIPV